MCSGENWCQLKNGHNQLQLYLEPQTSGTEWGHMSTCSMKNLPSISVQLTATSAMGIWKHWAIYRSSTSKALRQRGTAAVQQLCYNPCLTAAHRVASWELGLIRAWRCWVKGDKKKKTKNREVILSILSQRTIFYHNKRRLLVAFRIQMTGNSSDFFE